MEQQIKSLLFIKIFTFSLLFWMCHFYIYMMAFNKLFDINYNHHRELYIRNYRSLANYKQYNHSSITCINDQLPNGVNNKSDITSKEKYSERKKKYSNGTLPTNARSHRKDTKSKSCIFETKKYSHLEKKIFKELDYADFLKKNRTISDKIYKKIILKKCGLRLALPLLLFLVLAISFILDKFCGYGLTYVLYKVILLCSPVIGVEELIKIPYLSHIKNLSTLYTKPASPALVHLYDILNRPPLKWFTKILVKKQGSPVRFENHCVPYFLGFLIYFVPLFILGIILISGVFYYHKKVKNMKKLSSEKGK
ncbi:fam-l protein [Plasmodium malariae]|uniref:Fam-l protein n=1 Tax=Plasmodium malariae TaxID=5858 RepID=A0A1D3JHT8_PLAMA|nr:fam-l protein [Plasmodium malariae]SBT85945.1 fam-l protein [Plasmodium malariae]